MAGLVIGGKDLKFELNRLKSCNIIICTPGRSDSQAFRSVTSLWTLMYVCCFVGFLLVGQSVIISLKAGNLDSPFESLVIFAGIYILANLPPWGENNFCPNWKTGKNFEGGLHEKGKGIEE